MNEYLDKRFGDSNPRPFKIDSEMIELLTPLERVQIQKINLMINESKYQQKSLASEVREPNSPKSANQSEEERRLTPRRTKTFSSNIHLIKAKTDSEIKFELLRWIQEIFVTDPQSHGCPETLTIFRRCFDIFIWHFSTDFYEENDLLLLLQKVKEVFKHFDEVKELEFNSWYSRASKKIVKRAIFLVGLKIYKKCKDSRGSFFSSLNRYLGSKGDAKSSCLTFGILMIITRTNFELLQGIQ